MTKGRKKKYITGKSRSARQKERERNRERTRNDYVRPVHFNNAGERFCRSPGLVYTSSPWWGDVTCKNCLQNRGGEK